MDRIEAMRLFVQALDDGSLAAAGRRLGRSPATMTRAIDLLENHVGAQLLHRTTRSLRPSEAGERYAAACRRLLAELDQADALAASAPVEAPTVYWISAPAECGGWVLRPLLEGLLAAAPTASVRFRLSNAPAGAAEAGVRLALAIGEAPRERGVVVRVGAVREVVCAAPSYLAKHPPIGRPEDLAAHPLIALAEADAGEGGPAAGPRISVDAIEAAIDAVLDGRGVARLLSSHVAAHVEAGRLEIVLASAEPPPRQVHLALLTDEPPAPCLRALVERIAKVLTAEFALQARQCGPRR